MKYRAQQYAAAMALYDELMPLLQEALEACGHSCTTSEQWADMRFNMGIIASNIGDGDCKSAHKYFAEAAAVFRSHSAVGPDHEKTKKAELMAKDVEEWIEVCCYF